MHRNGGELAGGHALPFSVKRAGGGDRDTERTSDVGGAVARAREAADLAVTKHNQWRTSRPR